MELEFNNVISAHQTWTDRFKNQLLREELSQDMKHVGYDDLCEFGRWLYSLDDAVKATPEYRRVKDLHYRFHQEAELAVVAASRGDFNMAKQLVTGQFQRASDSLIAVIEAWRRRLPG